MSGFSRRQFLIASGLGGAAALLLPRWLMRQGGGDTNVSRTAVAPAAPVVDQVWGFNLSFPAYFAVLPAVIDPTATPPSATAQPTASATSTATATATGTPTATSTPEATGTPTMTPFPSATPDPLANKIYLPLVAKETDQ